MSMSIPLFQFDPVTLEYQGSREAQLRPNGEPELDALYATPDAPGPEKMGQAQVYRLSDATDWPYGHLELETAAEGERGTWLYIADHRPTLDEAGHETGGTDFWLPPPAGEDNWRSEARHMTTLGPLPEGACLTRPDQPPPTQEELAEAVRRERNRRLAATDAALLPDFTVHDMALTEEQRAEVLAYRAALRSLPGREGFPWAGGGVEDTACPWPAAPCWLQQGGQ